MLGYFAALNVYRKTTQFSENFRCSSPLPPSVAAAAVDPSVAHNDNQFGSGGRRSSREKNGVVEPVRFFWPLVSSSIIILMQIFIFCCQTTPHTQKEERETHMLSSFLSAPMILFCDFSGYYFFLSQSCNILCSTNCVCLAIRGDNQCLVSHWTGALCFNSRTLSEYIALEDYFQLK